MVDSRNQLSLLTVALHWLIAAAIVGLIVFGISLEGMPPSDQKWQLVELHMSIGTIVLVLVAWRLVRRIRLGLPEELGPDRPLERKTAYAVHIFLLIAPLLIPISGIVGTIAHAQPVDVFGLTIIPQLLTQENKALGEISGAAHGVLGFLLILAIALHILGTVIHQFVHRDGTLMRMLGVRIPEQSIPLASSQ